MLPIKDLLSKPMSRKEFLRLFALALLGLFGINNFISYILRNQGSSSGSANTTGKTSSAHGFGTSTYGR